jgi:hypothetical protein
MVRLDPSSGAVQVLDDAGALLWSGKPLGHDASLVLPVPGTPDAIVLLSPDAQLNGRFGNLLRMSPDGSVSWQVEPPFQNDDAFVAVAWVGDKLIANTWSCFRVAVDVNTGRLLETLFTK